MNEERKGELYLLTKSVLWAFFPIVSIVSFSRLPPLLALAAATFFAALFFAALLTYRKKWGELTDPLVIRYGLISGLFLGVAYYGFYFIGLAGTTAGNAAVLVLFEVLTSYVFFNILRKEAFPLKHMIGVACMLAGVLIVMSKNLTEPTWGDLLILFATLWPPVGNLYTQKARAIASAETILFVRSVLTVPVMLVLAYFLGQSASVADLLSVVPILAVSGIALLGLSKIFWVEAVHRISVTKAVTLQSVTPFLTLLLAWWLLSETPTLWQLAGLVPLLAGTFFLTSRGTDPA